MDGPHSYQARYFAMESPSSSCNRPFKQKVACEFAIDIVQSLAQQQHKLKERERKRERSYHSWLNLIKSKICFFSLSLSLSLSCYFNLCYYCATYYDIDGELAFYLLLERTIFQHLSPKNQVVIHKLPFEIKLTHFQDAIMGCSNSKVSESNPTMRMLEYERMAEQAEKGLKVEPKV